MTKAKTKQREPAPDLLQAAGVETVVEKPAQAKGGGHRGQPVKGEVVNPPSGGSKVKRQDVAVRSHQPPAEVAPNMLLVIARAASDPNVNPEKMRALLDMQKEIKAEEDRIAFTEAFIKMQQELPIINAKGRIEIEGKGGKRSQSTPYATFNEIHKRTMPILARHGFSLSFEPEPGPDGRIIVRGHLEHVRGHKRSCAMALALETSGSKNNVQGSGSSLSYGKRYCAISLLNLISEAQEDADDDGQSAGKKGAKPEPVAKEVVFVTPKQIEELNAAIEDCGVGLEVVCNKYEIDALRELPTELFATVMQACRTFKANQEAKRTHG